MTILKPFQQDAVDSATRVLSSYARALGRLASPTDLRRLRSHDSALLIEAPTGTGKTLMAGHVAQNLAREGVVWFWFAPFAGLLEQTEGVIRSEFQGLRVRDLRNDRYAERVQAGDVYVATWAIIANDSTSVHQAGELAPGLADFVRQLRSRGLRIGVVVDEAHHTFSAQNKAFAAYQETLTPDLTLLVTATPNDADIEKFRQAVGLQHVHRVSVSRASGVAARLLKRGVRVAVFRATQHAEVVDFRKTALRMAVLHHWALKELLEAAGVALTPLLLVQVEAGKKDEDKIGETVGWLRAMGFSDTQIRSHTAEEPNPNLIADAADDQVEVLLFKMAVATGFDAPRAFTLCSMRAAKDPDFGVQIVGRILRVDRRLQPRADLPEALEYGAVFLADEAAQTGLLAAGQRINQIRDSYRELTNNVAVYEITGPVLAKLAAGGQAMLLAPNDEVWDGSPTPPSGAEPAAAPELAQSGLFAFSSSKRDAKLYGSVIAPPVAAATPAAFRYPLRADLAFPRAFKRAVVSLDQQAILDDITARFPYDDVLKDSRRESVEIVMRLQEMFENQALESRRVQGALTQKDIAHLAQRTLFGFRNHDAKTLEEALLGGLQRAYEREGWPEADDPERVREGLQKIIALNPGVLELSVSEVISKFTIVVQADPIPEAVESDAALSASFKNVYGVMPADLNRWERAFADLLDDEPSVLWWHRNPVKKAHSVLIPISGYSPTQNNFYPDFVVGVKDRSKGEDGVVLVEVKGQYASTDSQDKAQSDHPAYGKVLMLFWEQEREWKIVEYDYSRMRNELTKAFDPRMLKTI